ncbi:GLPGLI family protein [Sphingobacterium siyangense]|uniref:GLPGLI family protein n=1 Tax=Sphingobacterium siyangense TaxID=459529 RepID=A0A562M5S8_9SPHI|nr:GLPGLI family protein [Sphingobacterium siyangense]TWI14921.1 GLPGLI family protein [Sphingobacterium siyangense]
MKLNNILLLFLVIFIIADIKAQEVAGYAHYAVVRSTDSINNTPADLSIINLYPFVSKVAAMMRFKLEFTTTNSMFNRVKTMELEKVSDEDIKTTETLIGYRDTSWHDASYFYRFDRDMKNPLDKKGLILKTRNNFDWNISAETKQIGEFTCYKAKGDKVISYREGGEYKIRKTPVIAWFCPEIPVPFGPVFGRDLPGLIFEFQYDGIVYGLTDINLTTKAEIAPLPNKEILTKEEWRERLYKLAKELNIPYQ